MAKIVFPSAHDGDCEMRIGSPQPIDLLAPVQPRHHCQQVGSRCDVQSSVEVHGLAVPPPLILSGRDRFGSLDSVPEYGADSPLSAPSGAVSGGIAAEFPRNGSGVSVSTGVPSPYKPPLTPSRSHLVAKPPLGDAFAGVSADCVKVDGVDVVDLSVREPMIPTPKV